MLAWIYVWLLVLVLVILRDPDWNVARDGGGFDFLGGTDVALLLGFKLVRDGIDWIYRPGAAAERRRRTASRSPVPSPWRSPG